MENKQTIEVLTSILEVLQKMTILLEAIAKKEPGVTQIFPSNPIPDTYPFWDKGPTYITEPRPWPHEGPTCTVSAENKPIEGGNKPFGSHHFPEVK